MTTEATIEDRCAWLDHLHDCVRCPAATCLADLCDRGAQLAASVRASMVPGETWDWGT